MQPQGSDLVIDTLQLAARHGLDLAEKLTFNEMGLDFRVAFAVDRAGRRWVLRVPRRAELWPKIKLEASILRHVARHLPAQVPDWQICTAELIAYPMLTDPVALTFDATTHEVTWHIDQHAPNYLESLAEVLVALHGSPVAEAVAAGIHHSTPEMARAKARADLDLVKREIGVGKELEANLLRWLDDDKRWPSFTALVHGDLYAGHVTADEASRITGLIDWSEAEISDPSIDFAGHLAAFDPASLERLVQLYERAGGRTWPAMIDQVTSRHAASAIRYGLFAISTKSEEHLAGARLQLGVTT